MTTRTRTRPDAATALMDLLALLRLLGPDIHEHLLSLSTSASLGQLQISVHHRDAARLFTPHADALALRPGVRSVRALPADSYAAPGFTHNVHALWEGTWRGHDVQLLALWHTTDPHEPIDPRMPVLLDQPAIVKAPTD